jgi:histidyl-tRNA synthetase
MKPSIPKGTRDFSPEEIMRRDFIFDTVRTVFRLYGYQPIETPAMENLSTLLGKYGEEGDRLIYRILNSGDFLSALSKEDLPGMDPAKFSSLICERGLRYDLTVPFARYVVQHRDEVVFPFKRYQIQPVWRADRPQKGRYREFFQCDVDVIGSDSLLNEYELIRIIDDIFSRLKIAINIKINNRKILSGIAEIINESARITDITVAIDKLERIGIEGVNEELRSKGIAPQAIEKLQPVVMLKGSAAEKLAGIEGILKGSGTGMRGIDELRTLFSFIDSSPLSGETELDLMLARGLNYYTGTIIEVKSRDASIGSICGGGRYDNLTGVFGMEGVSGVGISFGADRIYDVLNQLNLFDERTVPVTQVLILNFGNEEARFASGLRDKLTALNISTEIYPDAVKLKKQMAYGDARRIPFIVIAGEDEIRNNQVTLKIMASGEQRRMTPDDLVSFMKSEMNSQTALKS